MQTIEHSRLYDTETIVQNRLGQLTTEQTIILESRLEHSSGQFAAGLGLVTAVILFGFIGFSLQAIGQSPDRLLDQESPLVCGWVVMFIAGGVIAGMLSKRFLTAWSTQRLNSPRPVTSVPGQVKWLKDRYVALGGIRPLRSIYEELDLPPGQYEFYILRGTRWLIGASLRQGSSAQTEDLLQRLRQANGIIEKALPTNQNGRLTQSQRLHLLRDTAQNILLALILLPIMILSIAYFLPEGGFFTAFVFFGAIVVVTVLFLLKVRGLLRDFKRQEVHTISGRVTKMILHENDPETSNTYQYVIDGLSFTVSQKAYQALVEGMYYTFYYLPHSKTLVNIELFTSELSFEFA
jgi:hypothetical protein